MGVWGTYPQDSDAALDLKGEVNDAVNKTIGKISKKYAKGNGNCYDFAGLILLMLQNQFSIKYKFVEQALNCIKAELLEAENSNEIGWENVENAISDMKYLISEFEKLIAENRYFNESLTTLHGLEVENIEDQEITASRFFCYRRDEYEQEIKTFEES